ncbi:MAG TPA: hypothetical protein VLS90_05855 [Thermodesulfobacteriota bacterium]|nr:hypothetical protein [Thermodesulfobacteriota bacterium]
MSTLAGHRDIEKENPGTAVGGWLIVIGLSVLFFVYGIFMFLAIGDKGPPDWDFGTVEDIPGQSIYSTTPGIRGPQAIPEPQHVDQKPALVAPEVGKEKR